MGTNQINMTENPNNLVSEEKDLSGDSGRKKMFEFSNINSVSSSPVSRDLSFLLDIPLEITVELGRNKMVINELLQLGQGSVVELSKLAGDTLDIFVNKRLIAKGEVVVVNEKYGVRLTEIITPREMIEGLK